VHKPMTVSPVLAGNFAPIWTESDAYSLPVWGDLPKNLEGTLFRNGPNPQFMPTNPHHHWFGGDGMIHAFTVENGRVSYRNRWVRTPKWQTEKTAGRPLIDPFGPPNPAFSDFSGSFHCVANTNIISHAGQLLALEEGSLPVAMDRRELTTHGFYNFGGAITTPFTAHPKLDPETGELCFFGYSATGPFTSDIAFGTIDRRGAVTQLEMLQAPYASMVHDFCVTQQHLLFPIFPLTGSMQRAQSGMPPFAWEPDYGTHIGVLRRGAPASTARWFKTATCYVFHVMNAWEDGNFIYADVMQHEAPPGFTWPDGTPTNPAKRGARLVRWTIDLAGDDVIKQDKLDDLPGEFPRIDDRRAGLAYRHGFFAGNTLLGQADTAASGLNAIVHYDLTTGRRQLWQLPPGDATSEPVFVPRTEKAPEGDGYLLAVIWRASERRSDFVVLDASCVENGPVATAELSSRVPFGFHGNWLSASDLKDLERHKKDRV
jgi:carotenoid cleavage dioxygenase-like enzyme